MIMLKPLDQAIRDNDPIRAVISGTGINQDGKTPGITMPSGAAQGQSDSWHMRKHKHRCANDVTCRGPHGEGLP
jgi:hypothetical protein